MAPPQIAGGDRLNERHIAAIGKTVKRIRLLLDTLRPPKLAGG